MSYSGELFIRMMEEEKDDYRQDEIYIEAQKWEQEEEYFNSLRKPEGIVELVKQSKEIEYEKLPF